MNIHFSWINGRTRYIFTFTPDNQIYITFQDTTDPEHDEPKSCKVQAIPQKVFTEIYHKLKEDRIEVTVG